MLSEENYEVIGALDRQTALAECGTVHVDAVVADMQLRRESGLALLDRIRGLMPGIKRILMSGAFESEEPFPVQIRGAVDAVLPKPFEASDLREILGRLLG